MYVLVVREADGSETEYDLAGEVVLGREGSADIQLADGAVSRNHARIFLEDGLVYIEDLGSANGTQLDGQPVVGAVVLEPGRAATLGPFQVWVEDDGQGVSPPVGGDPDTFSGPMPDDGPTVGQAPGAGGTYRGAHPAAPMEIAGTLEGLGGVAFGQLYEVAGRLVVGRVAGNDIVLEDPSVSRQHAEIDLVGLDVVVRDLGSSNGTFVNGAPVSEERLFDGDIVRFGDVELQFAGGDTGALAAAPPPLGDDAGFGALPAGGAVRSARRSGGGAGGLDKRKKVLLAAGGAMIVLLGIGFVLKGKKPPPPPPQPAQETEKIDSGGALKEEVFKRMRRAKAQMEATQWSMAEDLLRQVVDMDPINKEARDLLAQVKLEKKMEQVYSDAERKSELGDDVAALRLFVSVDSDSSYHARARFKVRELTEILIKRYTGECLGNYAANKFRDAVRTCTYVRDVQCQCPSLENSKITKTLEKAETRAKIPPGERWRCPLELASWVPCEMPGETGDEVEKIKQRYTAAKIFGAVNTYRLGEAEQAMLELTKIKENLRDPNREQAIQLYNDMKVVRGKWKEGQALVLKGDPESAESEWNLALSADGKIMPTGATSWYRREIKKQLAGAYNEKANELYRQERYPDAFDWLSKGFLIDSNDTRLKETQSRLETEAAFRMRSAATCDEFRMILAMTQADPPSATHKQAQAQFEGRGCR